MFSDLHLETFKRYPSLATIPQPQSPYDLIVLAGDIHAGTQGLDALAKLGVGHVYVAGNHEYYKHDVELLNQALEERAAQLNLHFLQCRSVVIQGVRFLGATLWTDYEIQSGLRFASELIAKAFLPDFRLIRYKGRRFSPKDAIELHRQARDWLAGELDKPFSGKTVVVTHHAPHANSIHPRFGLSPINAAFVSDLTELVERADLWIHGHMHDSFDYRLGNGSRVVVNPRGYIRKSNAQAPLQFENRAFMPNCVIDI